MITSIQTPALSKEQLPYNNGTMIYLASDHGGFKQKKRIAAWLSKQNIPYRDLGPHWLDTTDDYPIWAARVARLVQRDTHGKGILLCRTGVGMALVANKFSGIRAVQGTSVSIAKQSRLDENTNVITIASDLTTLPSAQKILHAWLTTNFTQQKRHQRRLKQISRIEHAG